MVETLDPPKNAPKTLAINQCMELLKSPEIADYFYEKFETTLKELGLFDRSPEIVEKVKAYVQGVHDQYGVDSDASWQASEVKSDFENLQENIGKRAFDKIRSVVDQFLRIDFAVSAQSELLRAFSKDGQPIKDRKLIEIIDQLVNSEFAKEGMVSKGSQIFEVDNHGNMIKDDVGNPVKAPPEKVKEVMAQLFIREMQEKGLEVRAVEHAYAQPQKKEPVVTKPPQVEVTQQPAVPAEPQQPQQTTEEVETPTTPARSS